MCHLLYINKTVFRKLKQVLRVDMLRLWKEVLSDQPQRLLLPKSLYQTTDQINSPLAL